MKSIFLLLLHTIRSSTSWKLKNFWGNTDAFESICRIKIKVTLIRTFFIRTALSLTQLRLYSNRAASHLQLKQYRECIQDCTSVRVFKDRFLFVPSLVNFFLRQQLKVIEDTYTLAGVKPNSGTKNISGRSCFWFCTTMFLKHYD